MRIAKYMSVLPFFAVWAFGQQPPPVVAQDPPAQRAERPARPEEPLTPEEERAKQIRMYDPLDRENAPSQAEPAQAPPAVQAAPAPQAPLPGSVAASNMPPPANPRSSGPQVLADSDGSAAQDYNGPAVLSRSYTISRPRTPQQVKWTPKLGYAEVYDTGIVGGGEVAAGTLYQAASFGFNANWGLTGRQFWKEDQLGIDYQGSVDRYGRYSAFNGTNQTLNADYTHVLSRHFSLNLVTSASILSQGYSLENPATDAANSIANVNLAVSPSVQLLGQETRQVMNQLSLTWKKSARLSYNVAGGAFFVDRAGAGLYGNSGAQVQADVNYRYTRRTTVGVYYSFTEYTFSHQINAANFHTFGGIYSHALNRSTQVRFRGGITRIETNGLQAIQVPVDPVIAALLGQSTGIVNVYQVSTTSDISAQIVKDFGRNRTVNLSYARGISPGNGLLLTSTQESYGGSLSMLIRKNHVSAGIGVTNLSTVAQAIGSYDTRFVFASLARPYSRKVTGDFKVEYRTFKISSVPMLQSQLRISTGITWNPGEGWLRHF